MERRRFLSLLAAGTLGTGGCLDALGGRRRTSSDPGGTEVDPPVPESALHRATERDAIPAITEPAFARDWSGLEVTVSSAPLRESAEPRLSPGSPVIGVESEALASTGRTERPAGDDGRARAYPLSVLDWHEVVNDRFGPRSEARGTSDGAPGRPLLVTYCPLCGSGVVAERTVDGEGTVFGVSGRLWRGNLVMYDRATGSLWSQLLGRAIRGPRAGERLRLLPSRLTTWGEWREGHPETEVLLPPPRSNTVRGPDVTFDYTIDPYLSYGTSSTVGRGDTEFADDRLHPKAPVVGVASEVPASTERGGEARAYPLTTVERLRVVNDTVGGRPVVVGVTPDRSLVAYDRRVDGEVLSFLPVGEGHMRAGGSRWRIATGRAVDGPHEGRRLTPATDRSSMFWFAWVKLHPDTGVYRPWNVVR